MKKIIMAVILLALFAVASFAEGESYEYNLNAKCLKGNDILLSWEKDENASSYNVYILQNGEYVLLSSATENTYKDKDKSSGTTYKYKVASVYEDSEGVLSEEAVAITFPAKVKGLKVKCSKSNVVTLTWKKAKGADGYKVYRYSSEKKKYVLLKTTKKTKFVNKKVKNDTRYKYKVAAYSKAGIGEKSAMKAVRTRVAKVTGVKVKGYDWNKVRITWKKVKGADGYKVYRYSSEKEKYVLVKRTSKRSYIDSGRYPHTKYAYKVCAYSYAKAKDGGKYRKVGLMSKKASGYSLKTVHGLKLGKPLKHMNVGSSYGYRGGEFHIGVDFMESHGTNVYAATSGYVYRSRSNYGGLGNGIVIKNSKGVTTWYGHLSKRLVSQGSYVKKGQKIGKVGHSGNAGNCNHLHFEVWVDGTHYNPMKFY